MESMTWKTASTPSDFLGMTLNCILFSVFCELGKFWHYIAFTVYSADEPDVPLRNHIQLGYTHKHL